MEVKAGKDPQNDVAFWMSLDDVAEFGGRIGAVSESVLVARLCRKAYRLGRARGHVIGSGLGKRSGFATLFNLLAGMKDQARLESQQAFADHRYADGKRTRKVLDALETSLNLVQRMFAAAELSVSLKESAKKEG